MNQDQLYTLPPAEVWTVGRHETTCGIRVLTSWMPVQRHYETLVTDTGWTGARFARLIRALGTDGYTYATRAEAQDGHAAVVKAVEAWVALQEVA